MSTLAENRLAAGSPELIESLNVFLADLHIIGVKLHNYHWNVEGCQFFPVHTMTEAFYDYFFKLYDDVAERILQIHGKPIGTCKGYLAKATIAEDEGTAFSRDMVFDAVYADFKSLTQSAKALSALAQEAGDGPTDAMLCDAIGWLEKNLWMLRATLGGGAEKFHTDGESNGSTGCCCD